MAISAADEHLDCSWFGAILNNGTMNFCVQVFM